ncbi:MAG: transporter substrate-binding domain-containing protein [Acutalibacteraceae bacterium]
MKKICALLLCFILILALVSCNCESEFVFAENKTIAIKSNNAYEMAVKQYSDEGFEIVTYTNASDIVLALENGTHTYGILSEREVQNYLNNQRNIKIVEQCDYKIEYGIYFSTENKSLSESFNLALTELEKDGTLSKIKNAYLSGEDYYGETDEEFSEFLTMACDPSFSERIELDENGNLFGLDVEIAKAVTSYLGYGLEFDIVDFDEMFLELTDNNADFVLSAAEITEERANDYICSDPYFTTYFYLVEGNFF